MMMRSMEQYTKYILIYTFIYENHCALFFWGVKLLRCYKKHETKIAKISIANDRMDSLKCAKKICPKFSILNKFLMDAKV